MKCDDCTWGSWSTPVRLVLILQAQKTWPYTKTLSQINKWLAANVVQWYSSYLPCARPWDAFLALHREGRKKGMNEDDNVQLLLYIIYIMYTTLYVKVFLNSCFLLGSPNSFSSHRIHRLNSQCTLNSLRERMNQVSFSPSLWYFSHLKVSMFWNHSKMNILC